MTYKTESLMTQIFRDAGVNVSFKDVTKKNKQFIGSQAKKQGDAFEEYFKSVLKQVQAMKSSPIVAFRKHSNEVVGILHHKKMFSMIKKLGHLKGDLDFSITVKSYPAYSLGHTVFGECKSGSAVLSKEQKDLIEIYISNKVPFFIFCEKPMRKYKDYCILATHDFAIDKQNIINVLVKGSI